MNTKLNVKPIDIRPLNALVVVTSPLQLLYAFEYLQSSQTRHECVDVFVATSGKNHKRVMRNMLSESRLHFRNIHYARFNYSRNPVLDFAYVAGDRLLYQFSKLNNTRSYDEIIAGHYSSAICRAFCSKFNGKIVFVDDGIYALNCPDLRKQELTGGKIFKPGGRHESFRRLFWRMSCLDRPVVWFTRYADRFSPPDSIISNELSFLKQSLAHKYCGDYHLFIGMNLIEKGYISQARYIEFLHMATELEPHKPIHYLAKYSETDDNLLSIEKSFPRDRFRIIRPEVNFELFLAQVDQRPSTVSTYYSTALINAMDLLGPEINYASLDARSFSCDESVRQMIDRSYESIVHHPSFIENGRIVK